MLEGIKEQVWQCQLGSNTRWYFISSGFSLFPFGLSWQKSVMICWYHQKKPDLKIETGLIINNN